MDATIFVGTGVLSTVVAQVLINGGGGDAWTGLLPLFNYLGMCLCAAIPTKFDTTKSPKHKDSDSACLQAAATPAHHKRRHVHETSAHADLRSPAAAHPLADVEHASEPTKMHMTHDESGSSIKAEKSHNQQLQKVVLSAKASVALTVVLDIVGFLLSVGGLALAGSGTYQVLYSSVVVWAAVFSWILRGRRLSLQQAAGVLIVMMGLALSTTNWSGGTQGGGKASLKPLDSQVLLGMAMSIACAMTYGLVYVIAETVTSASDYPGPKALASRVGIGIVSVCLLYIVVAVAPRAQLIKSRIASAGRLSMLQVAALYFSLSLSSALHSFTYYRLVAESGATATGIFSSLRAVGVFAVSHPLFCSQQPSQCFTVSRALSSAVVIGGILLFSWKRSNR